MAMSHDSSPQEVFPFWFLKSKKTESGSPGSRLPVALSVQTLSIFTVAKLNSMDSVGTGSLVTDREHFFRVTFSKMKWRKGIFTNFSWFAESSEPPERHTTTSALSISWLPRHFMSRTFDDTSGALEKLKSL